MTAVQIMWGSIAANVALITMIIVINAKFQRTYDRLRSSYRRSVDEQRERDHSTTATLKNQQARITGLQLRLEDALSQIATLKQIHSNDAEWSTLNNPLRAVGYEDTMLSGPI